MLNITKKYPDRISVGIFFNLELLYSVLPSFYGDFLYRFFNRFFRSHRLFGVGLFGLRRFSLGSVGLGSIGLGSNIPVHFLVLLTVSRSLIAFQMFFYSEFSRLFH